MRSSFDSDLDPTVKVRNFSPVSTTRPSSTEPPTDDKESKQQLTNRLSQACQVSTSLNLMARARPQPRRSTTAGYRRRGLGIGRRAGDGKEG
jgi:hypothetical protein